MDARAQAPFTTCAVCKDENLPSADPVYLCGAGGHAVHQKESCEAALVDCVNQGCQVPVARKDVAVHAVVCPKRIVSCTYPLCEHKLEERITGKFADRMAAEIKRLKDGVIARHGAEVKLLKSKLEASCSAVVRIPIGYKGSLPPTLLPDDCKDGRSYRLDDGVGAVFISLPCLSGGVTWELKADFSGTKMGPYLRVSIEGHYAWAQVKWKAELISSKDRSPTEQVLRAIIVRGWGFGWPEFIAKDRLLDPGKGFLETRGDVTFLSARCWIYVRDSLQSCEVDGSETMDLSNEPEWTEASF